MKNLPFSVHLAQFPTPDPSLRDIALEQRMELARRVCSLGHSLRKKANIRVRQPLPAVHVFLPKSDASQIDMVSTIVCEELNVRAVKSHIGESGDGIIVKKVKPNFKTLGPKLGTDLKIVLSGLATLSVDEIRNFEKNGNFCLVLDGGKEISISALDVDFVICEVEGFEIASDGVLTVALDLTVTAELKAEGLVRDLVKFVAAYRKDYDFNVSDRISIWLYLPEKWASAAEEHIQMLKSETLSEEIYINDVFPAGAQVLKFFPDESDTETVIEIYATAVNG